jgi:selenide,water dikinase
VDKSIQKPSQTLVLVGAGHANIALIRRFVMDPLPDVRLVVINPEATTPYSGMLPGFLSRHYTEDELFIDIAALCSQAGARFIRGSLHSIDPVARTLTIHHQVVSSSPLTLKFDNCVLNTGASPADSFPNRHRHCYYVKPIRDLLRVLPILDQTINVPDPSLAIVGGGAAGVELAFAFRERYGRDCEITIVSKYRFENDPSLKAGADQIRRSLVERYIKLIDERSVVEATEAGVLLDCGQMIPANAICVAIPVSPPSWIAQSLLPTSDGFLRVDQMLCVQGTQNLYAAGDIVSLETPRGRSGVMAVRAGEYLAKAIWTKLNGHTPKAFNPQKNWLTLLNLGDGSAIGIRGAFIAKGRLMFRLKDAIDRRFVRRFRPRAVSKGGLMRCEGCAAKLPGMTLETAFSQHFEDAAIEHDGNRIRFRSIDALTYLVNDPYLMGFLTVRHAVSDIWAMGGSPTFCLSLIAVQRADNQNLESEEFAEVIRGVQDAATAYEITLVGGHSLSLDQPMVAISIEGEGLMSFSKQSVKQNDELWLTGPIGSGILFAALSAGESVGNSIDSWINQATQSLSNASRLAVEHGVNAMTDVTGFGLAGHVKEMLGTSGFSMEWSDEIDVLDNVARCTQRGIRSTAHESNKLYAGSVGIGAPDPVVFDPQTCGPLLIAIQPAGAHGLIKAWREVGLSPQRVGRITTETS